MRTPRLCVSLTPDKLDEIFSSDITGADFVEVRLDYLKEPQEAIHTRWNRLPIPVIATCRGKDRGGRFEGSIEEEIRILEHASANGAAFIEIDYRFARPFGNAQVIGSWHDFSETPSDVESILERTCMSAAHIGKIATTVNSWSDNRALLDVLAKPRTKPVIIEGMGDMGQITRILGPSRGGFLTYAAAAKSSVPGQLSMREMLEVYRVRKLGSSTRLIGIIGNPLGHSLSPVLHNRAFDALNLDFVYLKFPTIDVKDFFNNACEIGIEGFSVTIPHKLAVIPFLSSQSPEAMESGAVNTVYRKNGGWIGDNTDVHGVRSALASVGFNPSGKSVVIMGAGGGAKAAKVALKDARSITVLPRRDVPSAGKHRCDLLVNATPVGMYPNVDTTPIEGPLNADIVLDMVYNPPITRLLRSAAEQGKSTISGTTMFVAQARKQFEIWTGRPIPPGIFEEKSL
jgi:3-dehydroquinate dehydratase/shikimate dehydrogenase